MSSEHIDSKILIVDDVPENIKVLSHHLNNQFTVSTAESGAEAFELIKSDKPDLILLDIMMPAPDGFEVCRILKSSPETENIPIIFISALDEPEKKLKGFELGAVDYITKPFYKEEVSARVRTHIENKKLNEKLVSLNQTLEQSMRNRATELNEKIAENIVANKELQDSQNKFKALFEGAPDAMLLVEFESGEIAEVNSAGCRIFGLKYEELIGRDHGDFFIASAESDEGGFNENNNLDDRRKRHPNNIKKSDGTLVPVENSIKTVLINGNIYLFAIIRDVSERVRYQKELVDAKNNAEQMNRLKSIFLANLSHELRTPLISILGFSNILQEDIEDEDLREMVDNIYSSGMRLLETFNLLLNLTSLESGDTVIKKELLDPADIIEEVIKEKKESISRKGLSIDRNYGNNIFLNIDSAMFKDMVRHIIGNAVKFTKEGTICISTLQNTDDENYCDIIFADSGIGIKEDDLSKIFDEFRQGSEGNNRNYEGTGLGLTITKKFVELNNGYILVESKESIGSTFTLRFALAKQTEIQLDQ